MFEYKIERTFDADYVNGVLRHPDIYPLICGSYKGSPEDVDATKDVMNKDNYFLVPTINSEAAGVVIFDNYDGIYKAHLNVLPKYCGNGRATEIAKRALSWMFNNTKCQEIIASIPTECSKILMVASRAGMKIYDSKNGKYYLSITSKEMR